MEYSKSGVIDFQGVVSRSLAALPQSPETLNFTIKWKFQLHQDYCFMSKFSPAA